MNCLLSSFFRDTHVKVEGPAVADLARMFVSSVREAGYPDFSDASEHPPVTPITLRHRPPEPVPTNDIPTNPKSNGFVQILESNAR